MSTRRTTPKEKSDAFLEPIVKAALARRGTKKQLADALSKRTGENVPRERVERWLKTDPEKRQQPLLGSGLLLLEEFDRIMESDRREAFRECPTKVKTKKQRNDRR